MQLRLKYPFPAFGLEGEPLKVRQIYRCKNEQCPTYDKRIESWLTVDDAKRLVDQEGLLCWTCQRPLKWIRAEPLFPNPQQQETK